MEPETFLRSPLTWASSCLLQPLAVENPLPIDCEAEPLLAPFENAKLQVRTRRPEQPLPRPPARCRRCWPLAAGR